MANATPPERNTPKANDAGERVWAGFPLAKRVKLIELAINYANEEMALKFLENANTDLWDQLLADANRASKLLRQLATKGKVEVARLVLKFVATHFNYAGNIFTPGENGFTALHAAALNGHAEIARLLLEFAFDNPSVAELILAPAPQQIAALHAATQGGHVEVVRVLLESPFYARFLDSPTILPLPDNQEIARAVGVAILEYAPQVALTHDQLGNLGELEASIMAMNVQRVRELLDQGRFLENNGELLAAMLRNTRNFNREQMRSFVGALETMRWEMLARQMQARSRALLEQALLDLPLALDEQPLALNNQPLPQNVQTMDQIIAVIRPRLLPNLQTLSFESLDRAIRNIGGYGGRGQFANEESANNIIRRAREPSAPELINGVLPGARLFASELLPYLFYYFLNQYRAFPGANNK